MVMTQSRFYREKSEELGAAAELLPRIILSRDRQKDISRVLIS